jgi:hypothetical protein
MTTVSDQVEGTTRMNVAEAAVFFRKSDRTILRWIAEGRIVARKDPGGHEWWVFVEMNMTRHDNS